MVDTIFALASAPGRAGVAVIRISGPKAGSVLARLTGVNTPTLQATKLRALRDPATSEVIDRALTLWFPNPHSFTGEDVAELQIHGGRAILERVLGLLAQQPGCRLALPGEFTRRAFEHGKLDLTEAEAIADLVDAETEAQRRQAVRQLDGALGQLYNGWTDRLAGTLARLEAYLDFPDEALPPELEQAHASVVADLQSQIADHLAAGDRGQRLRDGIRITIIGAPNAGKSSLLNVLAARKAAIVSPQPGTTRDVIEAAIDFAGYPVILQDTAGLRASPDAIEAEGVRRALARAAEADLKLLVFDRAASFPAELESAIDRRTWLVANKSDLPAASLLGLIDTNQLITVSAEQGDAGIEPLRARLEAWLVDGFGVQATPSLTRARHREALEQANAALARSQVAVSLELVAEDLRLALRAIGQITGTVDVEQLLDRIFRDFCIGK